MRIIPVVCLAGAFFFAACDHEREGQDGGVPEDASIVGDVDLLLPTPDFAGGGVEIDGGLVACATETQKATLKPLDLYLMLDSSSSMNELTSAPGMPSKWSAVSQAISSFVNDPASAGLGVGLQFFPLIKAGTMAQACSSDTSCGALAPCIRNKACAKNGPVQFCQSNADCGGATCAPVGTCSKDSSLACFSNGGPCGQCNLYTLSYCSGRDSCTASEYQAPAVPIATLPGAAGTLSSAISGHMPDGFTPTAAALRGAVDQAEAYAVAHPDHVVVAVLATDGFPTECTMQDIPSIAGIAGSGLSASPSVRTFVIGVFTDAEKAQATTNLDQIAAAGGTSSAYVISTTQNVSAAFLAALDSIRGTSLPCEYALPVPASGMPDYGKVNVQFTSGGTTKIVPYVTSTAACDPVQGGWVYDADPATSKPSKVILCPQSCDAVRAASGGQVDIVQGCQTIIL